MVPDFFKFCMCRHNESVWLYDHRTIGEIDTNYCMWLQAREFKSTKEDLHVSTD